MKKIKWFGLVCILCLAGVLWSGCNANNNVDDKITIVCTNFPLYDWTRQILGECNAEVILLLDNGTDMHSFQPSAEELIQIADCDVLVHVGGASDAWLTDALVANPNEARVVVNLMDVLEADLKEETYTEGMKNEHVHEDGACTVDHDHKEATMDEHVWLSLRMALKACDAIEEALCQVLPQSTEMIHANAEAYCDKIITLDQNYADAVSSAEQSTIIMADRFPFMYMMEDYDIRYYAAFPGCSTESEADFETVVFLAEKVKECEADVILITESGTDVLAKTVMENAGADDKEVLILHSLQVVYNSDIEAGCTYLGYMETNLEVLKQVLNCPK